MLDSQEIPISICSHQNTEEETVKNATCTEKGEKRTICKDCGETVKTESIAALGHAFGEYKVAKEPTCDEKGEETSKCSRCDEEQTHEVAALGHEWDEGKITTEATPSEAGIKTYTCKRCGETKTEDVPYQPKVDPKYTIKNASYDKDEMLISGIIEHDASTETAKRVFARVTFFMSDGTFVVLSTIIDKDGTFQSMCSGDVIHIAVQVTDSAKVRPGDYKAYGGREFDVE